MPASDTLTDEAKALAGAGMVLMTVGRRGVAGPFDPIDLRAGTLALGTGHSGLLVILHR